MAGAVFGARFARERPSGHGRRFCCCVAALMLVGVGGRFSSHGIGDRLVEYRERNTLVGWAIGIPMAVSI